MFLDGGRQSDFSDVEQNTEFLKLAAKIMYIHKDEFKSYEKNKLQAVKSLKEYTGGRLKECKEACDLYWEGKLSFIKEERLEKLERLAKMPLVQELMDKLKNIKENELHLMLINLSVDQLLSIDEIFTINQI